MEDPRRHGSERVTYVLDRGLVRFAKFAAAVLAVLVIVGTYVFGIDLRDSVKDMRALRTQINSERGRLVAEQKQAALDLKAARAELTDARAKLDEGARNLDVALADVKEAKDRSRIVADQARGHLTVIETHLTRAGIIMTWFESKYALNLNPEQKVLAAANRRDVIANAPGTFDREGKLWPIGHVLRVRFLDGPSEAREIVKRAAVEWERYANVRFQFVSDDEEAEIRVAFQAGKGSWSYRGTNALGLAPDPEKSTMNLGWDVSTSYGWDTVLHQFGHVLGLVHEHQNPSQPISWNVEAVRQLFSGPPNFWPRDEID
jgi:hypothetical protein